MAFCDLNEQGISKFPITCKYFQIAKMSRVTFTSLSHADSCGWYLEDLSSAAPGDPCSQVVVVTGAGRVSVSRRLLQLLSPLVREAVASLPVLATLEPLTIILPDTDTSTVKKVMDLLCSGQTHVEAMDDKESVTNLAECLSISMQNLSLHVTGGPGAGKIRLRNMSEVLMPGFNFNNNSNKTPTEVDEELLESEDGERTRRWR